MPRSRLERILARQELLEKTDEFLRKSRLELFNNATEMKQLNVDWDGYDPLHPKREGE